MFGKDRSASCFSCCILFASADRSFFLVAANGDTVHTAPFGEHETFCQSHPKVSL